MQETAQDAYGAAYHQTLLLKNKMDRILGNAHPNLLSDKLDWGYVGSLNSINEKLAELVETAEGLLA